MAMCNLVIDFYVALLWRNIDSSTMYSATPNKARAANKYRNCGLNCLSENCMAGTTTV